MDSIGKRQIQNRAGYDVLTDDELVRFCQDGDQIAFGELIRRHHASAFKIALSIVRDKQDAEDEVQNAFWKAYQHINQFRHGSKFSTWLTRIVVNQCLMQLRRSRRAKFAFMDDTQVGDEIITFDLRDPHRSPEEVIGETQVAKVLHQEIRRTPPLLRNVFLLRDVERRPMQEVADHLGISVAAAKSRLLRARAELRNRMSRHYGNMGPATLMASS